MKPNLENRTALISGSSRGIGRAIADAFLAEGMTVFVNGRDRAALDLAISEMKSRYPDAKVHPICADLIKTENVISALDQAFRVVGRFPDVVVANVGSGRSNPGVEVEDGEWERMFDINLFGAVRLVREAVRRMKDAGGGSIVCVSSIAGCEASTAPLSYSAAKAALLSFVKNASDLVAKHHIRINAVSPGNVMFEGGVWDRKLKENREQVMGYINSSVPLQRFATPQEIAEVVAFLVSDKAAFVTGTNVVVDGGQLRKII